MGGPLSTKGKGRGEYNRLYIILGHHFDTVKKGVLFLLVFSEFKPKMETGTRGIKSLYFSCTQKLRQRGGIIIICVLLLDSIM